MNVAEESVNVLQTQIPPCAKCREIMRKQPELYAQVNEYRLKNFDIQNESEGSELFDRMEAFEREYREFRENPMVDDFLRAELALCRMVQEMNVLLTAEIDFE